MDVFAHLPPVNNHFVERANACTPQLSKTRQVPLGLVTVERDETAPLGWCAVPAGKVEDMRVLNDSDSVIFDFGGHRTGYLSFRLQPYKHGLEPNDSPCRLRLVFGEIISDIAEEFYPYTAWLSKAWLPDEIINVDYLPQQVNLPRRYAFRYVKVEVVAVSRRFGVKIENVVATAVSSAPASNPPPLTFSKAGRSLSDADKTKLRKIDDAALLTLRNCMQTVYEDGPRRDMRLWIGDLRLQALTNYATFNDTALAKRCLYLFAATPVNDAGLLSASCYERPYVCSGGQSIVDFSHIYAAALRDYVVASGDAETGRELFPTALTQFAISLARVDPVTGIYAGAEMPVDADADASDIGGEAWHFIDWQPELHKTAAEHAVIVFGLRAVLELAQQLGLDTPSVATPFADTPLPVPDVIERLVSAARKHLYHTQRGVFLSGVERQLSWASNAWAVMADIPETREQAARALRTAYEDPTAVIGMTPYLHHYLCEAFVKVGLDDLAVKHILGYWGSMIDAGAETFWEAWDPKNPRFSPYSDVHANSFCHAWSCTPSLLLRRLGYE